MITAWASALIGYFGPWIGHKTAALAWNAYDLFDILRFLPQIETFKLMVNLQTLRLPLIGLSVLLPLIVADAAPAWRWSASLIGVLLTIETLPPYPQIIGAWSAPGWRIPFWWGTGAILAIILGAAWAPKGKLRPWAMLAWIALTGIPAFLTFARLLPALQELYQAPVHPGWGTWTCAAGLLSLALLIWLKGISPVMGEGEKMNEAEEKILDKVRTVKTRHETSLLRKPNVIGVGIGIEYHKYEEEKEEEEHTREIVLIVNVTHKVPIETLEPDERIPEELEGIPVKVKAIGYPQAQD